MKTLIVLLLLLCSCSPNLYHYNGLPGVKEKYRNHLSPQQVRFVHVGIFVSGVLCMYVIEMKRDD